MSLIIRFLKDLKEVSKREKIRREVEKQRKTVNIYNKYATADCYESQKSGKGWQALFSTLASFCNKYEVVLDVGCGPYELMAVKNDVNTVGVDMSDVALKILLNYGFLGHVVQADCRYLPFKSGSFDCLISNQMIEHMSSKQSLECALREMTRFSRNLMIVTPNSVFRRRIHDATHFFFFTVRDLKRLLPSFRIYASHLPPRKILCYYFLYNSPRLRRFPLFGSLIYGVFCRLDSSRFMGWLSRWLWVGSDLVAVKTEEK